MSMLGGYTLARPLKGMGSSIVLPANWWTELGDLPALRFHFRGTTFFTNP